MRQQRPIAKAIRLPAFLGRVALLICLVALLTMPLGHALNQATSQDTSSSTYAQGSDDDMDEATRNAMKALMAAAALQIPTAFNYGYTAYGNYTNSEKMDDLDAIAKSRSGIMISVGNAALLKAGIAAAHQSAASGQSGISGRRPTTFSRLDPAFLYKGETAAVAEEFEKRTGMKREEFLQHMAKGTDAKLQWDDPNLMSKLEQHYQVFKARIPNQEFRESLEKAEQMVPMNARAQMLGELMGAYQKAWANAPRAADVIGKNPPADMNSMANPVMSASGNSAGGTAAAAPSAGASDISTAAERAPASVNAGKDDRKWITDQKVGFFIGIKNNQDALNEFFKNANLQKEDDTIFQVVSTRYRKLTPALLGQANVVHSR